jgi:hypothetical protein
MVHSRRVAGLSGDSTATADLTDVESIQAVHSAEAAQYSTLDREREF